MKIKIFTLIAILILNIYSFAEEEGVTDTEIRIAQFGPLSGPASPWGDVVLGTGFLFKLVNEEGGIHGRKINYRPFDDSYNPAKTKYGVKLLQEKLGIFAWVGGVGTETALSVKDYLVNRNIPWVIPITGSEEFITPPNKYIFTAYPLYSFEARILCKYAVENMGKKKIAIIYQNDGYGKSALKGATEELLKHNMEIMPKIPLEVKDNDYEECINTLIKSDSDTVLVFITPFSALRLLLAAKNMNFTPQWMGGNSFSDFPLLYRISHGLWKGMIATTQADFTDTPILRKYKEAFKKYASEKEKWSLNFQYGIGFGEPLVEALKRCGRDLTRERFIKEIEGLGNFKGILNTGIFKPFDPNDPESRRATKESYIIQCIENGNIKKLSDWIKID
ncbi:MAG: ABC transporter substrate-binding protein [Desulfobacterales bacterium]|nr:ABC transporter substrate-binding protein [Desulfobacterales bacterium]MBF0397103.1 ABC transporter substrate-binding protein [Desulfobacterales bacterium]